jgi:ferrous iron transport protein A
MSFWKYWAGWAPALLPRSAAAARRLPKPSGVRALDVAPNGLDCRVVSVQGPEGAPDWPRWLAEIGFLPGERVTVTARSPWGGDPMVVRIGQSTFALRRAEAACVRVEPL